MSSFLQHNENQSKTDYEKQIKQVLRAYTDRYGYIEWSAARQLRIAIDKFFEAAQKQIDCQNYTPAINLCTAIMEQTCAALQYSDDSSGEIGYCVETSYDFLYHIAEQEIDEPTRTLLFDYCISAFKSNIFDGWDWHMGVLEIAALILKTEDDKMMIFKCLDKAVLSEFCAEEAQNIRYKILQKTDGEKASEAYLMQNLANDKMRDIAIEQAFEQKNFDKAIVLAKDGIEIDQKDRPGLLKKWIEWLFKIAQKQRNTEKIIEYARWQVVNNFHLEQDYYQVLKNVIKSENWDTFLEKMIEDISKKGKADSELVAQIYINEQWWSRLINLLKNNLSASHFFCRDGNLRKIAQYEKYLVNDYVSEIIEMYIAEIKRYLEYNTGRNYYENACRYLRRVIKLGGKQQADETINFLRTTYFNRRALLEELDKV